MGTIVYAPAATRGDNIAAAIVTEQTLSDGSHTYDVHAANISGAEPYSLFAHAISEDSAIRAADLLAQARAAAYKL